MQNLLLNKIKKLNLSTREDQSSIIKEFIRGKKHLLEAEVAVEVARGNDKEISHALGLIHHRSSQGPENAKKTYIEAILSSKPSIPKKIIALECYKEKGPRVSKFFSGFLEDTQVKELYRLLKREANIRDIILPKRRDKRNKRYGFIV